MSYYEWSNEQTRELEYNLRDKLIQFIQEINVLEINTEYEKTKLLKEKTTQWFFDSYGLPEIHRYAIRRFLDQINWYEILIVYMNELPV